MIRRRRLPLAFRMQTRPCRAAQLAAVMLLASMATGQLRAVAEPSWRGMGPGGGGWMPTVVVSPHDSHIVYLGCDVGGFFESADAGATWRVHNNGLHDYCVEVIAPHPHDPQIIYVGTQGGVHKSTDGGETWQWLRTGFPPPNKYAFNAPIAALAIDPEHPDTIYAGIGRPRWDDCGQGAVYRTTDGGTSWELANPGGGGLDPQAIISDLVVHPRVTHRLYAASDRGLYRSDDAGSTWQRLGRDLPGTRVRRLAVCPTHPEVMYLTLQSSPGHRPWEGGLFRSDDGGDSWRSASQGLPALVGEPGEPAQMTSLPDRVVVHPSNPDIVYMGDASWVSAGIYRTLDGGNSWQHVTRPGSPEMDYGWIASWGPSVTGLALDPQAPDTLYFTTSGHAFRTIDAGEHWQQVYTRRAPRPATVAANLNQWWSSTGLEVTCPNDIAVPPQDPQHLYFCYLDIGLLQSRDGGRSFAQTVEGMRHRGNVFTVAFDPDDPDIMYAGTGEWAS